MAPISARWQQDGRRITGRVSFKAACETETVEVTQREQIKETRPNPAYSATAFVVGSVLSAVGVGLFAASGSQDDTVYCGDGSGGVQDGDECHSKAGIYQEAGAVTLGTGLGLVLLGVLTAQGKPKVEKTALAPDRRMTLAPGVHPCGDSSQLDGIIVAAALADGGRWSGKVDGSGVVNIELSSNLSWRDRQVARFSVESVPAKAARFISAGMSLGELELAPLRQ